MRLYSTFRSHNICKLNIIQSRGKNADSKGKHLVTPDYQGQFKDPLQLLQNLKRTWTMTRWSAVVSVIMEEARCRGDDEPPAGHHRHDHYFMSRGNITSTAFSQTIINRKTHFCNNINRLKYLFSEVFLLYLFKVTKPLQYNFYTIFSNERILRCYNSVYI